MTPRAPLTTPAAAAHVALELTNHARERMAERGIRISDVVLAFEHSAYVQRDAGGVLLYGCNGVALVLDATMTVVVTVLPRGTTPRRWRGRNEGAAGWRRDPAQRRNGTKRRSPGRALWR